MNETTETHLKVLRLLEENPDITQRELARALGISLGKANYCLKALIDRGWVKVNNFRSSDKKSAYAYLLTPAAKSMTADAKKRLEAIESLEDLGAGFTLATHDLEIRGAGELLGDEQSGQITEVGYALYTELLERAVKAIKAGRILVVPQVREFTKDSVILENGQAISPDVVNLIKAAWLIASVEYGASKVRSGHLLLALLSDESLEELHEMADRHPLLEVVKVEGSTSKAQNVNAVLHMANGAFTGMFDADHMPRPGSFERAWRWLANGYDVVQGHCMTRNGEETWLARMIAVEFESIYAVAHPGLVARLVGHVADMQRRSVGGHLLRLAHRPSLNASNSGGRAAAGSA